MGTPVVVVTVPLISLILSVNTIATFDSVCPLRTSIGVSVTSRSPTLTDFNDQPRRLPFDRTRWVPAGTPASVNRPSLSTRALGCGPDAERSVEGAVILTCVMSGAAVCPALNVTVPVSVPPTDSMTARLSTSLPLTLIGCAANCGVPVSSLRARRM